MFLSGLAIMADETIRGHPDPTLVVAAIGMMGLPLAKAAENIFGNLGATESKPTETRASGSEPPEKPRPETTPVE